MLSGVNWPVVGVVAAILLVVVTGLLYWSTRSQFHLGQILAGRRRPVLIGKPRNVARYHFADEAGWDRLSDADQSHRRLAHLYLFNQSHVAQQVSISARLSPVLWPRYKVRVFAENRQITMPPASGGNVDFVIASETFGWPDATDWPKRSYLLWLRALTAGGHKVRFLGWVRLRPLRKIRDNQLTDTLFHVVRGRLFPN